MTKLVLTFNKQVIREYPFVKDHMTVGRKPENDIQIDNLAVSGHHSRIDRAGSRFVLTDLGSTNGTFIKNKKITSHVLTHGDNIQIGKHVILFLTSRAEGEKAARDGAYTHGTGVVMPWGLVYPKETFEHRANFEGSGPEPVDTYGFGIGSYGCYNMAGNVKEWCINAMGEGYAATGGSWEDPAYMFGHYGVFPGLYSSGSLGFRCVYNSGDKSNDQKMDWF